MNYIYQYKLNGVIYTCMFSAYNLNEARKIKKENAFKRRKENYKQIGRLYKVK